MVSDVQKKKSEMKYNLDWNDLDSFKKTSNKPL